MKLIMVIIVLLSNKINPDAFDPNQTEGQNLNVNTPIQDSSVDWIFVFIKKFKLIIVQINPDAFDQKWVQINDQKENDASNDQKENDAFDPKWVQINDQKENDASNEVQDLSVDWIFVFIIKLVINPYSCLIAIAYNILRIFIQIENSMKKKKHISKKLGPVENSSAVELLNHIRFEIRQEMFKFHQSDIFNDAFLIPDVKDRQNL